MAPRSAHGPPTWARAGRERRVRRLPARPLPPAVQRRPGGRDGWRDGEPRGQHRRLPAHGQRPEHRSDAAGERGSDVAGGPGGGRGGRPRRPQAPAARLPPRARRGGGLHPAADAARRAVAVRPGGADQRDPPVRLPRGREPGAGAVHRGHPGRRQLLDVHQLLGGNNAGVQRGRTPDHPAAAAGGVPARRLVVRGGGGVRGVDARAEAAADPRLRPARGGGQPSRGPGAGVRSADPPLAVRRGRAVRGGHRAVRGAVAAVRGTRPGRRLLPLRPAVRRPGGGVRGRQRAPERGGRASA